MPDMEKVIKGLECCAGQCNYHGCPYKDPCENANGVKQIMLDALAMLKEQEAEIRQLRLALDIAKGTCKGIVVEGRWSAMPHVKLDEYEMTQ